MTPSASRRRERGGRQPGDGACRSAGRPQRNRRCPDPGPSVARASAGQPAGGAVDAGCRHDGVADSVGNICGRYEGQQEGAPAVLLGSHLDTVRNAGRYDGMLGVLAAIEVVQRLHQQGRRLAKAIERSSALAMKRAPALASPCSAVAASPAPGLKLAVTVRFRRGERRPGAGECRTRSGADRPRGPSPAGYRRLSGTAYRAGAVPGAGGAGARRGGGD